MATKTTTPKWMTARQAAAARARDAGLRLQGTEGMVLPMPWLHCKPAGSQVRGRLHLGSCPTRHLTAVTGTGKMIWSGGWQSCPPSPSLAKR